jgi:glycosyltransferase involved in cell wall biosynthesis
MPSPQPIERERAAAPATVLVFVPYYLPGYKSGGPVRSIANLVARLGEDLRFVIVTADRDSGDRAPYRDVVPGAARRVGNADVVYVDAAHARPHRMAALIRRIRPDVLYLNSFFSPAFSIGVLLLQRLHLIPAVPIVLAPRGEFSPGALQLKAPKKRLFLAAARVLGLHRDVLWHATTPLEAAHIRRALEGAAPRIVVAPIIAGASDPESAPTRAKDAGRLRVAFLSRLSAKKNLLGALEILHGVRGNVDLDIYGPVEDESYWRRCRAAIDALPPNVRASYGGPVAAEDVAAVLADHDLFFLPTLGENYGHVIREALAAGTPVLISDQTPWRDLDAQQVGWDLPLDRPDAFRAALERCIAMSAAEFAVWREHAAAYARRHANDDGAVQATRRLFSTAAAGGGAIAIGESGMLNAS